MRIVMTRPEVTLVGRSSSHFTRTARIFALELEVPFAFRPVLDINATDRSVYADNPALKVPVLVDEDGPLYGTENICRAIARRSGHAARVVLRGELPARVVANAEEMILHAMSSAVILVLSALSGDRPPPPKVRPSLENALEFLETNVDQVLASLPPERLLSFCETALYCLVTYLPFRKVMDVSGYPRLGSFCATFGQRPGALATAYRFDS
jgi:glutathione S-transferase